MDNTSPRLCVVGSSNMDLTFRAARLPRPGETLAGHGFQLGFGGKGANQAVMAARLGARVTMVSRVGKDVFGEQTIRNYREQGIDTDHVTVDDASPSGVAGIVVDDAAQNCILVVPGANGRLTAGDVRAAAVALQSAAAVLCQMEVPAEASLEAFRIARAAGVRTVLNPAPAGPLPDGLTELTELIVPNETELEILTGRPTGTPEQAEAAARLLLRRGWPRVLVTLGERGALLVEGDAADVIPAVPVAAVDPTGAGDVFIGGLAVYWARGLPLRDAARRAGAVAALSVTRLGAQAAFPSRAEVEAFLAKCGLSSS
jgi:ribokinase